MSQHPSPVTDRPCQPLLDGELQSLGGRGRRWTILAALAVSLALAFGQVLVPPVAAAPAAPRPPINAAQATDTAAPVAPLAFSRLTVADGLSQSDVRSIVQDRQGFMWFATWLGGLDRYDGYGFKVYRHDPKDPSSLATNSI
jgi:hypothetical protein